MTYGNTPYSDIGIKGILSLFDKYDKQPLVEYLETHSDDGAKLTPTLAHKFTELVETHGVYDWSCASCSETYECDEPDWDGDTDDPPVCPNCPEANNLVTLSGPEPAHQLKE